MIVSQYAKNEYKLASYKIVFLMGSSVSLIYNFQPSAGWIMDQEATDKHVRGVVCSILIITNNGSR